MKHERAIPRAPLWKILMFYTKFSYWWLFIRPIEKKRYRSVLGDGEK